MRSPYCYTYDPVANSLATAIRREQVSRHKSVIAEELHKYSIPFRSAFCSCGICCRAMDDDVWTVGDESCNIILTIDSQNVFETLAIFIKRWREYQSENTT